MNTGLLVSGFICSKIPMLCNRRASLSTLSDKNDEFMIVAGVNHVNTNRAIYASLTLVGVKKLIGVGGVNDIELKDSAKVYLDDPIADYLYAYIFARNCTDKG